MNRSGTAAAEARRRTGLGAEALLDSWTTWRCCSARSADAQARAATAAQPALRHRGRARHDWIPRWRVGIGSDFAPGGQADERSAPFRAAAIAPRRRSAMPTTRRSRSRRRPPLANDSAGSTARRRTVPIPTGARRRACSTQRVDVRCAAWAVQTVGRRGSKGRRPALPPFPPLSTRFSIPRSTPIVPTCVIAAVPRLGASSSAPACRPSWPVDVVMPRWRQLVMEVHRSRIEEGGLVIVEIDETLLEIRPRGRFRGASRGRAASSIASRTTRSCWSSRSRSSRNRSSASSGQVVDALADATPEPLPPRAAVVEVRDDRDAGGDSAQQAAAPPDAEPSVRVTPGATEARRRPGRRGRRCARRSGDAQWASGDEGTVLDVVAGRRRRRHGSTTLLEIDRQGRFRGARNWEARRCRDSRSGRRHGRCSVRDSIIGTARASASAPSAPASSNAPRAAVEAEATVRPGRRAGQAAPDGGSGPGPEMAEARPDPAPDDDGSNAQLVRSIAEIEELLRSAASPASPVGRHEGHVTKSRTPWVTSRRAPRAPLRRRAIPLQHRPLRRRPLRALSETAAGSSRAAAARLAPPGPGQPIHHPCRRHPRRGSSR